LAANPASRLRSYVLLAYGISWTLLAPWLYVYNVRFQGNPPHWLWWLAPLAFVGGSAPSIAGLIVAARSADTGAVRGLVRSMLAWRVPARWYLVALLTPPLATALSLLLADGGIRTLGRFSPGAALVTLPATYALALPFGPLGEELGWRGTALPLLLQRTAAWKASLIVGGLWTFWHIPQMLWLPGASIPSFMPVNPASILLYLVPIASISALITLIFVRTFGSILLAIIGHMAFNTAENVVYAGLPSMSADHQRAVYLVNVWVLAAIGAVCLARLTDRPAKRSAARGQAGGDARGGAAEGLGSVPDGG
jgi:membrane protease YdiL (CAAX protease family)